jgi:hypothetical protein
LLNLAEKDERPVSNVLIVKARGGPRPVQAQPQAAPQQDYTSVGR